MTCIDCDDRQYWIDQIAATKALITAIQAAVTAISAGAQSYQLDTGQSRQLVTRANVASLRLTLAALYSDIATFQARLGCGKFQGRPGW